MNENVTNKLTGFFKPPWEWVEKDLQALISDQRAEDWHIDYKESRLLARLPQKEKDSCVEALTKAVSALNNADGGAIVIGIKEERRGNRNYPASFDDGIDETLFDKTWLGQIITSNVDPPVPDLRINPVKLSGQHADRIAYVIYVPRGTVAVQAKDLIYYQRIEDRSLPMRGFQIRDVNNRTQGPDLRAAFVTPDGQDVSLKAIPGSERVTVRLVLQARNLSDVVAEVAVFRVLIPRTWTPAVPEKFSRSPRSPVIRFKGQDIEALCNVYVRNWRAPESPSIFKDLDPVTIGAFEITFQKNLERRPLLWVATCPMMEPRFGHLILNRDVDRLSLIAADETEITLDGMPPADYWRLG